MKSGGSSDSWRFVSKTLSGLCWGADLKTINQVKSGVPHSLFIFDLDGTLVDSAESISDAANRARNIFGFHEAEASFLHERIGLPAKYLFEDLNIDSKSSEALVFEFRKQLGAEFHKGSQIFPGVIEFLKAAKSRNYSIAVATNKPTELAQQLICETALVDFIDLTVGTGQFPAKPQPEMLQHCTRYFQSFDTSMFGDRREDMLAAHSSGVKAIGVAQSSHSKEVLVESGAVWSFSNFNEVHCYYDEFVWRR